MAYEASHTDVEARLLARALRPGARVLDAGCGRRTRLAGYRDRIGELVGVDLDAAAGAEPCPTALPQGYEEFTRPHFEDEEGEPQECQGGPGYNSWYGNGQANAFRAVTHHTSNR